MNDEHQSIDDWDNLKVSNVNIYGEMNPKQPRAGFTWDEIVNAKKQIADQNTCTCEDKLAPYEVKYCAVHSMVWIGGYRR